MQSRMTCFLCLKRSLALRNSRLSSERLRRQTFLSSTYFRCFQIPASGFNSVAYSGNCLSCSREEATSPLRNYLTTLQRRMREQSQTSKSLPGIWRKGCPRNRTTSGPLNTLSCCFIISSFPSKAMTLITEICTRERCSLRMGVWPTGHRCVLPQAPYRSRIGPRTV